MNLILGIVVVFGCVLGGFAVHGGHLGALWQPSELLIIVGAATGALIIANPFSVTKRVAASIPALLKGSPYKKDHYLELFSVMYELLTIARKEGMMGLERVIEDPANNELFTKRRLILDDPHAVEFIQDYLRLIISGDMDQYQLEALMDLEIETHHHVGEEPAQALNTISDSLPGFGIVAAVLGIVNTMGALGGPPEEIGIKVAAALVGTFLGILLAYGLLGPMSRAMERRAREENHFYTAIKTCIMGFLQGHPPQIAIEFGRKSTPAELRPSFKDLDAQLRGKKS
ncbi:MAG TPA: flagellar motor stator protein MotA [Steroidobacter sp.]|uniref:flagellar motor stator protein MotA n=1 Tax=Steroidobacter sp. TaxID=1978227 RepID=UPI002EDADB2C